MAELSRQAAAKTAEAVKRVLATPTDLAGSRRGRYPQRPGDRLVKFTLTSGFAGSSATATGSTMEDVALGTITVLDPQNLFDTAEIGDDGLAIDHNGSYYAIELPATPASPADIFFRLSSTDATATDWQGNIAPHASTAKDTLYDVDVVYVFSDADPPNNDQRAALYWDHSSVTDAATYTNALFGHDSNGSRFWGFTDEEAWSAAYVVVKVDATTNPGELRWHFDPGDLEDINVKVSATDDTTGFLSTKHANVNLDLSLLDPVQDPVIVHEIVNGGFNETLISFLDVATTFAGFVSSSKQGYGHNATGPIAFTLYIVSASSGDTMPGYLIDKFKDNSASYVSGEDLLVQAQLTDTGGDENVRLSVDSSTLPGFAISGPTVLGLSAGKTLEWRTEQAAGADIHFRVSANDSSSTTWQGNVTGEVGRQPTYDVTVGYVINNPGLSETVTLFFDRSSVAGSGTYTNALFGQDATQSKYWGFTDEESWPTTNVVVKADTSSGSIRWHFDPDDLNVVFPQDQDERVRVSDQDPIPGYLMDKYAGVNVVNTYAGASKDLVIIHDIDVDIGGNERLLSFADMSNITGHGISGPLVLGLDASKNLEFRTEGAGTGDDKFFRISATDTTSGYWDAKVVDPWAESYEVLHDLQVDWVVLDPGVLERVQLFINVSQEFSSYNSSVDQLYGHTSVGSRAWTIGNKLGHTTLQKVYVDTIGDINWGVFFANELTYTAEDVPVSFRTVQPGLYEGPEFFVDVSRLPSHVQDKTQLIGKTTEGTGTAAMIGFALEGVSISAYPRFHAERINSGAERLLRLYWDLSTVVGWTSGGGKMITNNGSGGALIAETAYVVKADTTDVAPGYLVEEFSNSHAWGSGIYNASEDALIHFDVVNSPNSKLQAYFDSSGVSGSTITGEHKYLRRAASTGTLSWATIAGIVDTDEKVKVSVNDISTGYLSEEFSNSHASGIYVSGQDMVVHHDIVNAPNEKMFSFVDTSAITGYTAGGTRNLQIINGVLQFSDTGGVDTDEKFAVTSGAVPGYWDERVTGGSAKTAYDVTVGWAVSGNNVGLHFDSSTVSNFSGVQPIQLFGHNGTNGIYWNVANLQSHAFLPVYVDTFGSSIALGVDFKNEFSLDTEDFPVSFRRVTTGTTGAEFFLDADRVGTSWVQDKNQILGKTTEGTGTAAWYGFEGELSRTSPHPILKHQRINSGNERLLRTWLNLDEISGWDGQGAGYVLTNNGTSGALEFAGGQGVPRGYQSGVKQRVIKNESDKIAYEDVPKRPHTSNWTGFIGIDPTIDYVIPWSSQIEAAVADHALSLSAGEYTVLETGLWLITISSLFSIQGINTRVTNCYATMEFHNGSSWIPSGVGGTTSQGSIPIDPDYIASGVPYPSCNTSETTVFPLTAGWKIRVSARARQTDKANPRLTSVEATTSLTMWKVGG